MDIVLSRIIAGVTRFSHNSRTFLVKPPTRLQRLIGQEIYEEAYASNLRDGLYSNDELLDYLLENAFWDDSRQQLLNSLPKKLEELKVDLFQTKFKTETKRFLRGELASVKKKYEQLYAERHEHDSLGAAGCAQMARAKYVIGIGLYGPNGQPRFTDDDFWGSNDPILESAITAVNNNAVADTILRALARNDEWRTIANAGKRENGVFGCAAADLTDEQRNLLNWSSLYDNVYEHPECPSDDIIEEDDALDGWLILQRRDRSKRQTEKDGENLIENEKIRNSGEVFVFAETEEDAARVDDLNDDYAKAVKRQRARVIKEKGALTNLELPDVQQQVRMDFNNLGRG